jgi:hypothetical protein
MSAIFSLRRTDGLGWLGNLMAFQNEFLRNDVAGRRLEHGASGGMAGDRNLGVDTTNKQPGGNS